MHFRPLVGASFALALWLAACGSGDTGTVVINGAELGEPQKDEMEAAYGVRPAEGAYWYDAASGLWGPQGGAAAGFLLPGHDFGALAPDASGGGTGVFVNGRELPPAEWASWSMLFGSGIAPGRYWLDGDASYGVEGSPFPTGNLLLVVAARMQAGGYVDGAGGGGAGGGDNLWTSRFSAGNSNADNSAGYVSVPGVGPVGYGM